MLQEFCLGQRLLVDLHGWLKQLLILALLMMVFLLILQEAPGRLTLPAGTLGDEIGIVDYAGTFDTENLTVAPNGAEKIQGAAAEPNMCR